MAGRVTKAEYEKAIGRTLSEPEYAKLTAASGSYNERASGPVGETATGSVVGKAGNINASAPGGKQGKESRAEAWNAAPGTKVKSGVSGLTWGGGTPAAGAQTGSRGIIDDTIGGGPGSGISLYDATVDRGTVNVPSFAKHNPMPTGDSGDNGAPTQHAYATNSIGQTLGAPTKAPGPKGALDPIQLPANRPLYAGGVTNTPVKGPAESAAAGMAQTSEDIYEAIIGNARKKAGY